jgi:hypothetical protein
MKKNEIYVVIDSKEKRLRAIEILRNARERKCLTIGKRALYLRFKDGEWIDFNVFSNENKLTQITLEELEAILSTMTIDELKAQAEMLGFELVKKERKPKVGEFGVFWDDSKYKIHVYDFIHNIENDVFTAKYSAVWKNFRHLTEEEKQEIQTNW